VRSKYNPLAVILTVILSEMGIARSVMPMQSKDPVQLEAPQTMQGIFLVGQDKARGERLAAPVKPDAPLGSFDSVNASLREAFPPLRMTNLCE
jgi:hypothetical protein